MSKHDLESGARWAQQLASELDESNFGILCLTQDNLESSWLLFEAGALVKHSHGHACGLLIGNLLATDVAGPLSQFQHRNVEKSEIFQLLKDLNKRLDRSLRTEDLESLLDKYWPDLEADYGAALKTIAPQPVVRSERELLEEILTRVRGVEIEQRRPSDSGEDASGDIFSRPISVDSIGWYTLWKFSSKPVSEKIQVLLLRDLDEAKYQTIADIDHAVERARPAIQAYENDNPGFFKFGTDYITKSLGFVDLDFRSRHGFAAQTRQAFEKYQQLVSDDG